mmetsp:Transcript_410/g.537  ORF Transcript_410/g.537 Transcript_410/m.537 type:complete len:248 (-) Transcript_410:143-886(-)
MGSTSLEDAVQPALVRILHVHARVVMAVHNLPFGLGFSQSAFKPRHGIVELFCQVNAAAVHICLRGAATFVVELCLTDVVVAAFVSVAVCLAADLVETMDLSRVGVDVEDLDVESISVFFRVLEHTGVIVAIQHPFAEGALVSGLGLEQRLHRFIPSFDIAPTTVVVVAEDIEPRHHERRVVVYVLKGDVPTRISVAFDPVPVEVVAVAHHELDGVLLCPDAHQVADVFLGVEVLPISWRVVRVFAS